MVEEIANDRLVLNQPAGHLDPGERMVDAAIRETYEETGWHVRATHILGFSRYHSPFNNTIYYRTTFIADPVEHDLNLKLDEGIVRALWLTFDEIAAQEARLRSPLVLKNLRQFRAGVRFPLSLIDDYV